MSCIISSLKRTQTLRTIGVLPKIATSAIVKACSEKVNSQFSLSPIEANLRALQKFKSNEPIFTSQTPSMLRLPTLDRNFGITFYTPLIKPCIKDSLLPDVLEKFDPLSVIHIEEPSSQVTRKEATRMIGIRRKKMKKHKLRKLRKKMKYVWLKYRQKLEYKKEKDFQESQMVKIREAEAFDAVTYVNNFIAKTKEKPAPTTWRGKRLPKDVIRILMENDGKYIHPQDS